MLKKKDKPEAPHTFWGSVHYGYSQFWRRLLTGFLIWLPLIITLWVSYVVAEKLIFGLEDFIKAGVDRLHSLAGRFEALAFLQEITYRRGLGFLLAISLFLTTGYLTRYLVGRKLIAFGERIVRFIPFFNRVYHAVTQIRDVFVSRDGAVFQQVCLIEYPRPGLTAVAFVTSTEQGIVQRAVGKELTAVFVPTTPNPTSGYLVYLAPEEITPLDISVEDAMKLIISGGAFHPEMLDGGSAVEAPERVGAGEEEVGPAANE